MYTVCKIIKKFIYKTKNIGLSSLGCVQWPDRFDVDYVKF